jgi:hypothetical protein
VLELVRDAGVVAPLAYTGWQLREALRAYAPSPEAGSFLVGWQQGFGHAIPSLGDTAQAVTVIVGVAIALFVATRAIRDAREGRAQGQRVALSRLISEATLVLAVPAGRLGRARTRLTNAAATLNASLQSTVDYFAGLSANGRKGAGIGLHRTCAKMTRRLGQLADEIVESVLAGDDASDLLAQFRAAAGQLSSLLAEGGAGGHDFDEDAVGPGRDSAAAEFIDAVHKAMAEMSGTALVPAPKSDILLREEAL